MSFGLATTLTNLWLNRCVWNISENPEYSTLNLENPHSNKASPTETHVQDSVHEGVGQNLTKQLQKHL